MRPFLMSLGPTFAPRKGKIVCCNWCHESLTVRKIRGHRRVCKIHRRKTSQRFNHSKRPKKGSNTIRPVTATLDSFALYKPPGVRYALRRKGHLSLCPHCNTWIQNSELEQTNQCPYCSRAVRLARPPQGGCIASDTAGLVHAIMIQGIEVPSIRCLGNEQVRIVLVSQKGYSQLVEVKFLDKALYLFVEAPSELGRLPKGSLLAVGEAHLQVVNKPTNDMGSHLSRNISSMVLNPRLSLTVLRSGLIRKGDALVCFHK